MSEHDQAGSSGSTAAGWFVMALGLALGLWIFATFPMSWTHTDVSDAGSTEFTGTCAGPGAVDWTPQAPSDPNGLQQASDYCQTWSPVVVLVASLVVIIGVVAGAALIARRPGTKVDDDLLLGEEPEAADTGADESEAASDEPVAAS